MKQHKRIFISLVAVLVNALGAFSQHYDKNWVGLKKYYDKAVFMEFEGNNINFYEHDTSLLLIDRGITAMSNAEGELQFYTNGNAVVSWDERIMEGGKCFNEGSSSDDFNSALGDTVINSPYNPHTYRIIPDAYDEDIYYMVHAFIIIQADSIGFYVPKMQISKIDMSANNGRGKVVYKNRYFDEEMVGAGFAVVRHGNGRDWWVVLRKHDGLAYRSILLHRDSVVHVVQSSILGLSSDWFDWDDWVFTSGNLLDVSQDGSRLLDIYGFGGAVKLMDFDRCSGQVSLIDTFSTGITPLLTLWGIEDCRVGTFEFSPSGRYLYGAGYAEFAQWDLWADDIPASKVTLGGVPWYVDDDQQVVEKYPGGFAVFAPGPDGKLYNLYQSAHSVIEYPDEKGEASGTCIAADNAPVSCLGADVPYFLFSGRYPHYRLGPLPGSGCDTILSSTLPPPAGSGYGVVASPSVASGQVEVSITLPGYGGSTAELQVVDMLGRVVYQHRFAPYAYLHVLEVSGWAAGLYNVVLIDKGRARASTRLVVGR
jgi:hypothetical protein